MPAIRLTFLYPHLFRAPRLGETVTSHASTLTRRRNPANRSHPPTRCTQAFCLATATSPKQSTFPAARHGKAVEPMPLDNDAKAPPPASSNEPPPTSASPSAATPEPGSPSQEQKEPSQRKKSATTKEIKDRKDAAMSQPPADAPEASPSTSTPPVIELGAPTSAPEPSTPGAESKDGSKKLASGPMDAILHMEAPESSKEQNGGGPPHLSPPPYVHHFDTYSLVKQLEEGGYTRANAITVMKAVRALLAQNLDVAQAGLVSKRDMDNETYLFRAACSELGTEVKNNRRIADEQMRQQRTHVQHEVDISTQTLNQELLTLNDNVKGMFNDRRMAVREEQKANESAIQQINYKISVLLTSDAKASIEAMRWVLIRRGILGLLVVAVLTVGTFRYASYLSSEKKERAKKAAQEAEELRKNDGRTDRSQAPDAVEILTAN